jgi:hypothetical protein
MEIARKPSSEGILLMAAQGIKRAGWVAVTGKQVPEEFSRISQLGTEAEASLKLANPNPAKGPGYGIMEYVPGTYNIL